MMKHFLQDTDSINLYKNMRETLVYLTHLDYVDTEQIMTEKLHNQVNGTEWSWKNLNTLCWAIGSISGKDRTLVQKRQEVGSKYWFTLSSVRSYCSLVACSALLASLARSAVLTRSLACLLVRSLTWLTSSLVGQ